MSIAVLLSVVKKASQITEIFREPMANGVMMVTFPTPKRPLTSTLVRWDVLPTATRTMRSTAVTKTLASSQQVTLPDRMKVRQTPPFRASIN